MTVFGAGPAHVRYLNQGRAEGNRPHLFPAGQHDTLTGITAACPEMAALASLVSCCLSFW